MYKNPDTGRKIKEGAATWRRLTSRLGYRVVAGRLLRPEHADVEARAVELLGNPLNLPAGVTSEELAAAIRPLVDEINTCIIRGYGASRADLFARP